MAETKTSSQNPENSSFTNDKPQDCGVVMPISAMNGYPEQHWADIKNVLFEAIESAGLSPSLVSDSESIGVIMNRIVSNLFSNPIVVIDVSAYNPNCMFELGMRLAFDKPVIIVKDSDTNFSFDTGSVEHLTYPRGLRYNDMVDFKAKLAKKLLGTLKKANTDVNFSPFLGSYATYNVAKVETKEISQEDLILKKLDAMHIAFLQRPDPPAVYTTLPGSDHPFNPTHSNFLSPTDQVRIHSLRIKIVFLQAMLKDDGAYLKSLSDKELHDYFLLELSKDGTMMGFNSINFPYTVSLIKEVGNRMGFKFLNHTTA